MMGQRTNGHIFTNGPKLRSTNKTNHLYNLIQYMWKDRMGAWSLRPAAQLRAWRRGPITSRLTLAMLVCCTAIRGDALLRREPRPVRRVVVELEDAAAKEAKLKPTQFGPQYVDDGYFQPWKYNPFYRETNITAGAIEDESAAGSSGSRKLLSLYTNSPNCGVYPNTDPCCIRCLQLDKCSTLNHKYIEDKYTPQFDQLSGSCNALEDQAGRLDVFGDDKTFRDNDLCREMVYAYSCLWWSSASTQYDNRCSTCCSDKDEGVPLRPCRSFCFQIANICANRLDYEQLCLQIPCPPRDSTCDLGPHPEFVDVNGFPDTCYLMDYVSPESAASTLPLYTYLTGAVMVVTILVLV